MSVLQASLSGFSSLSPFFSSVRRSMACIPAYGTLPHVNISHTVTPYDHCIEIKQMLVMGIYILANHISSLIVDGVFSTLRSHPSDRNLFLRHALSSTKVDSVVYVL